MKKRTIIAILLLICILSIFCISIILSQRPECYLVEKDVRCGVGYYVYPNDCFKDLKLTQCCRGNEYLLKGVYGDLTCWWILSGQDESLLNNT